MTQATEKLPRTVEGLTTDWLTSMLRRAGHDVTVTAADQTGYIWGTATKVLVTVAYAGPDADTLPTRLCVKGGFQEQNWAYGLGPAYELEGNFFRDIASSLSVPLPRSLASEAEHEQGVIILEDLRPAGTTFGTPLEPWNADRVASAIDVMARWHGQTWDDKAPRHSWLPVGCLAARTALGALLTPAAFEPLTAREYVPDLPAALRNPADVQAAYQAMWSRDDVSPLALSHGDAHVGQTYVDPVSGPACLDWQGVCLAPWSSDLTYFIGGAMTTEDRRASERDLLNHYLDVLSSSGGPTIDFDTAWSSYREHTLHGFIWAVTPAQLQSEEIVAAMSARYIAAIDDHDAVSFAK